MRVNYKTVAYCLTVAFMLTSGAFAAEDADYIIGKDEDQTLLNLSITFLVVCALFLLVSIVTAVVLMRKVGRASRGGGEYRLEEREERYQNMYGNSKGRDYDSSPSSQYQSLKLHASGNGVYQSIDSNGAYETFSSERLNGESKTKQVTPPSTEKGQKDSKETEKPKTLTSFQNPAYVSSIPEGLDKEVNFEPSSADHNEDTAL